MNNKKIEEEKQELKEQIEKYNEMLKEDATEKVENSKTENIEALEEVSEDSSKEAKEETTLFEDKAKSIKSKKNKLLNITIIVLVLLIISSGSILVYKLNSNSKKTYKSIDDYTEEEREIAGFSTEPKKDKIEKEIDKIKKEEEKKKEEILYTPDYIHYEQLSDKEKAEIEIIPPKEKVSVDKLEDLEEEIEKVDEIPAKYNINDVKKLKMDNQESFGLCWAFATLESMETHYLIKNNELIDLSELALDNLTSEHIFGYRPLHDGGNFSIAYNEGNIKGVRKEKDGEYHNEIVNLNTEPFSYLDEDEEEYYLTDYVNFPSIYKKDGVADISEEELSEYRNLIKRHIMTNGSLYVTVNHNQLKNKNIYNSSNNYDTHAVSIVGWDDTYSKDNFKDLSSTDSDKKPIHDGAYIIKNSWGEEWGDKGYHYISYDDQTIESLVNGVLSMDTNSKTYLSEMPDYIDKIIKKEHAYTIKKDEKGEYVFNSTLKNINSITITKENDMSNEEFKLLVKFLPNISTLTIEKSRISDISPILELNNLQALRILSTPSINNFYLLSELKHLSTLELINDGLTDISFVSGLNTIIYLDLSDNNITDISPIANIDRLYTLRLNNNNIGDVSILKDENIKTIYLSGNKGITGYGTLSNIYLLDISNCELDSIEDVNPGYINISNNNLTTLPNLKETNETYIIINASNNKISDLSSMNKNFSYQSLDLSNNQITDISILNDIKVTNISLSNNNIKDTSKFKNDEILYLKLSGNKDIKVTKELNSVQNIELDNCNINSLNDLSNLENVTSISLKDNNITSFDGLDKLNKLTSLDLSNNKISTLKDAPKSNVTNIVLTGNDIKDLEGISNLKKLNTLYLNDNKNINNLNELKESKTLKYLYLDNIGELDISVLSDVLDNTEDLSISLMKNTLKGNLKGTGEILNISNSTYDNLDINSTSFTNINMNDSKGKIEFENIINRFDEFSSSYLIINLDGRKISYDTVKNNKDKKNINIYNGTVDYKINYKNNEYNLDNKGERQLFVSAYGNSSIHNISINDTFDTITKTGEDPYIIPSNYQFSGFYNLKYNIINNNPDEDLEGSLFHKYVKSPIRKIFKSLFGKIYN